MSIIDLSAQQPNPPPPTIKLVNGIPKKVPKALILNGKAVVRARESITGITLHATGCYFGPDQHALKAGASREQARDARALRVHAHMTCFANGDAVLAYPREWYVYHGHSFCPTNIGQEHEGDWGTDGKPIAPPPDYDIGRVIDAGRAGIESHLGAFPNLRFIHLHRQTRGNKPACPGPVITREVGLWACQKFGLVFEPERTWRDGLPIPKEWIS